MKKISLILLVLMLVLCVALASCGGNGEVGSDSDTHPTEDSSTDIGEDTADLIYTDTEVKKCDITISGVNISSFTVIVPANDDTAATSISEYILSSVKGLTGIDIPVSDDSAAESQNEIIIGNTSRFDSSELGEDEFLIKVEGGKLFVLYAEGASAYQAVTSILTESLFSEAFALDGIIAIEDGFVASGKCDDYVIGDNEFNPFE